MPENQSKIDKKNLLSKILLFVNKPVFSQDFKKAIHTT